MNHPTSIRPQWLTLRLGTLSLRLDRRAPRLILLLMALGFVTYIFSISYGAYDINMLDVAQTLFGIDTGNEDHHFVVWTLRMPRILVATMVGAALAVSGALMQGITRNPLADPGILGVTSGASLVAVAMLVQFDVGLEILPYATFAGANIMALAIYVLAWKGGSSSIRLILVGIGLAAITNALTQLMIVFGDIREVQQAYVWLAGSVYGRGWDHVHIISLWLAVLLPLTLLSASQLNTLGLGDDMARGLGVRVELQRAWLLFLSVSLASVAVAVAGTVGFIGLVAPHITRRLVGPNHEGLLLCTALLGGTLALFADLVGRMVIAPSELPLGVVTAMIGGPYFLFLLYRDGKISK